MPPSRRASCPTRCRLASPAASSTRAKGNHDDHTMPSRAPATATAPRGGDGAAGTTADNLWAKAAELERDFAGYKRRLAERMAHADAAEVVAGGRADKERRGGDDDAAAAGRGRRYEEYVRRRDERLRHEWRARMERKEAEMQALWARLDRAGSRGRRDGGELVAARSNAGEDHGNLRQKPGNLEVKVRPTALVTLTPRCGGVPSSPATKLSRPRTSVPSSPAAVAASPRLSTPDHRRRPSHLHREQPQAAEPPATPRKENSLPPPPAALTAAAASPATPRPRTTLSRSRSLFKDRGSSAVITARESPRPPRIQPPRSSYGSASSIRDPAPLPPHADAIAVTRSNSCSNGQAVLVDLKKASAVAPEPFRLGRSGNGSVKTESPPQVIAKDEPDSSEVAPAGDGNADRKNNQEHVDQSSDKVGSVEITGDSDTEPNYVYIKKDSGEQTPRPCQASTGLGTCPVAKLRSGNKDSDDDADNTMESTGSNDVAGESPLTDAEDASRRESSESLYSNVESSFSPRSELDTSATDSPLPSAAATEQSLALEDAEKSLQIPITPRSSVTVSITVHSPMDAVTGLKRFLTFGKKNSKGSEAAAAVVEHTLGSMAPSTPPGDGCTSGDRSAGDSVKARLDSSDVASADDLDNSYVISPHVRPLQSFVPSYPANPGLKEPALHAQSPRVHRSFFSFSSFKSRAI